MERRALALALSCSACLSLDWGNDYGPLQERSSARYIEEFCEKGDYELEGTAERTTGLTNDSCGFSVGPSAGVVRFIVRGSYSYYTEVTYSALVTREDGSDANWIRAPSSTDEAGNVIFEVYPEAGYKKRRIVDVRFIGTLPDDTGCSIGRGGRRRANLVMSETRRGEASGRHQ